MPEHKQCYSGVEQVAGGKYVIMLVGNSRCRLHQYGTGIRHLYCSYAWRAVRDHETTLYTVHPLVRGWRASIAQVLGYMGSIMLNTYLSATLLFRGFFISLSMEYYKLCK